MNNVIAYVAPKNKTMAHSMSLNNRISCVVRISIFEFKTYWKQVFNLMEIKKTPTFEQFLQVETLNTRKNKSLINEQCDSIRCAKKQDDGAQHEPKQ